MRRNCSTVNDTSISSVVSTATTYCRGIPEIREGNASCKHEWVYDDMVYTTNPPIVYRICKYCKRVEAYQGYVSSMPNFWHYYDGVI